MRTGHWRLALIACAVSVLGACSSGGQHVSHAQLDRLSHECTAAIDRLGDHHQGYAARPANRRVLTLHPGQHIHITLATPGPLDGFVAPLDIAKPEIATMADINGGYGSQRPCLLTGLLTASHLGRTVIRSGYNNPCFAAGCQRPSFGWQITVNVRRSAA